MMSKQYTAALKAKVVQELWKEEKTLVQIAAAYEVHPTQLKNWRAIVLAGRADLFEKHDSPAQLKAAYEQHQTALYAEIGKVTTQLTWLKTKFHLWTESSGWHKENERKVTFLWACKRRCSQSVGRVCTIKHARPEVEEIRIKQRMDEIYTAYPHYGSRRMTAQVQRDALDINRQAVQRHLRAMGIEALFAGPNLSRRRLKDQVYPYWLRNVTAAYPNHVWGIDSTSIRMQRGWM
jgi:putative transposase